MTKGIDAMPDTPPTLQDSLAALDKAFVESMNAINAAIEAEFEQGSRQAVAQLETFNAKVKEVIESHKGIVLEPTEAQLTTSETEAPSGDARIGLAQSESESNNVNS